MARKTILLVCLVMLLSCVLTLPVLAADTKTDFEPFDLKYGTHGYDMKESFRFVVSNASIPFEVTATNMLNLKVEGEFEAEGKTIPFSSRIMGVELRDGSTVLIIPGTEEVPASEWRDLTGKYPPHTFNLKVYPEIVKVEIKPSQIVVETDETPIPMNYRENCVYYFLNKANFQNNLGGWTNDTQSPLGNLYGGGVVAATTTAELVLPYDATYYVWVRARDYAGDRPGTRYLNAAIDGNNLANTLGKHAEEGFQWELAGYIDLKAGAHELSMIHTSGHFGRFDMVCVTDDRRFKPVNSLPTLAEIVNKNTYDPSKVVISEKGKEVIIDPNRPETDIAVKFNDEWMQFDVDPVLINDRTMVPLRAIFEKLGCEVSWDDVTETAIAKRNGVIVTVTVGSNAATIAGEPKYLDQPPVLLNDRTMVPLRFVSEAFGCYVEWQDETQSVFIEADEVPYAFYITGDGFGKLGTWSSQGDGLLQGISDSNNEFGFDGTGAEPAVTTINITKAGTYKLWIRAKDYATNKPGSRYFHISFNGTKYPDKFGDHGKEGFAWEEAGTYELQPGSYNLELLDTSGFFARFNGAFLTSELDFVPPTSESDLRKVSAPYNALDEILPATYPGYVTEDIAVAKTDSIENETTKVVFYQGASSKGNIVQYEIFAKDPSGNWQLVKGKNEESGFLMKSAAETELANKGIGSGVGLSVNKDGATISGIVDNYYRMGDTTWLIPDDFIKVSDSEVKLYFPANDKVAFSATYSFDDLVKDLKVSIDATFNQSGDYSFSMFNGDGVEMEDFHTVTAPMLYVKHDIPDSPVVITQPWMFTPMNTLYFKADNNKKTPGLELTSGLVVDPTCVDQRYTHPDTSDFGTIFYTTSGKVRPSLVAPVLGTDRCTFAAGDTYNFSYRIVNRFEYWYDTFKHVAVDMYNNTDLRTNYYGSINDSIYNIVDLMKDDFYGGWSDDWMGWYNMEGQNLVSQSNSMILFQRYLLSEDPELLEERVVPTIAYVLSRGGAHFLPSKEFNTESYAKSMAPLSGFAGLYGASVWGGMYEMSQGRMPYLLNHAITNAGKGSVAHAGAVYKYTGSEEDKKALITAADNYLANNAFTGAGREKYIVNGFVYGDYITITSTLVAAYELTGDQKYLDAAEEAGRLLMTVIWTTGYQNDYATNTVRVDPVAVVERPVNVDVAGYNFFWHGEQKWRPGNQDGFDYSAKELYDMGTGIMVPEEEIPGWLAAPTAHGTEHPATPGHGNVITMNNWLGMMVRLSKYTGDEWFETQARNAIIGRYQNYPGYYIDRYVSSPMHADYPYKGPDMTSLYWHHIPIYLAMVEDFLINEAWAKSNGNVEFPHLYQSGYAYFNSYQFGHAPGKFYDEEDMWLWIDKDIINPDNINIDYITAKKDGVLGIELMNEDNKELTTTVKLGAKIPNAESINTTATLYDENGNKSTVDVVNGAFTVTVPSKGMRALVIKDIAVQTPNYVREYTYSNELGSTTTSHTNGKGYVIQVVDDFYHAYLYISDTTNEVKSATLTYTVNGETKTVTDTTQGLEWLIKVDDPNADFTYTIEVEKLDGTKVSYGGGTLKTLANSDLKDTGVTKQQAPVAGTDTNANASVPANTLKFDAFDLKYGAQGMQPGLFRFVVSKENVPIEIKEAKDAIGLIVKGELVDGDKKIPFESYITNVEFRDTGYVFVVKETSDVSSAVYTDNGASGKKHKFVVKVCPQE